MKQIGQRPENASPEFMEAWEIIQGQDRSDEKRERLGELQQLAKGKDRMKIGCLIEAFIASI